MFRSLTAVFLVALLWPGVTPAYSTLAEVTVQRSFEPARPRPGQPVQVSLLVTVGSIGSEPLRGFWISDAVPAGLEPTTASVVLDGQGVTVRHETGQGILACCSLERWVLETPPNWSEGLPLAAGSSLEISYQVTVPADAGDAIVFPGFSWVAMIPGQGAAGDHFAFEDNPAELPVDNGSGQNLPPQVVAAAQPSSGEAPLTVNFSAQASDPDGQVVAFHWQFGDGQEDDRAECTHSYQQPGSYVARLEVTDDDGATASDTVTVMVFEPADGGGGDEDGGSGDGGQRQDDDTVTIEGGCSCAGGGRPFAGTGWLLLLSWLLWRRRG